MYYVVSMVAGPNPATEHHPLPLYPANTLEAKGQERKKEKKREERWKALLNVFSSSFFFVWGVKIDKMYSFPPPPPPKTQIMV